MNPTPVRCLILACGNTLRSDDGVGPWLATWAEERFNVEPAIRVLSRQQWTPDLAEEIAHAESVLFIDCAIDSAPGDVLVRSIEPKPSLSALPTHHVGAPELLALSEELYASSPPCAAFDHRRRLHRNGRDLQQERERGSPGGLCCAGEHRSTMAHRGNFRAAPAAPRT